MLKDVRVGIPFVGHENWMGGVYWACNLIKAVCRLPKNERPKLYFWLTEPYAAQLHLYDDILPLVDGIIQLGANWKLPKFQEKSIVSPTPADFFTRIDLIFPVLNDIQPNNFPSITWIPDFQHIHMPEMFSDKERGERDAKFNGVAAKSRLVVFSSQSARADWNKFFPNSKAITRILHFQTIPEDNWFKPDPEETRLKYNLPPNYLICCNQFWMHKNHKTLFQAIAELHRKGLMARLVCTGNTDEYRNKEYFPSLKALLSQLGIVDNVQILGQIPRAEQIALVRQSMAVIQPSLFEGWSTVVEDARLLGKTIFMSDLDVHKEQAPPYGYYFARRDPVNLAKLIADHWHELRSGSDVKRESVGRNDNDKAIVAYGRRFAEIISEAIFVMGLQPAGGTKRVDDLLRVPLSAEVLGMVMNLARPSQEKTPKSDQSVISLSRTGRSGVSSLGGQVVENPVQPGVAAQSHKSGVIESCDLQARKQADEKVVQLIQAGNLNEAVNLLQSQFHIAPEDGRIRSNLGWALAQMARRAREMALHRLTWAFVLDPARSAPRKNLAVMLIGLARKDDARCLYDKAMQMCPGDQMILGEADSLGLKIDSTSGRPDAEIDLKIAAAAQELKESARPDDQAGRQIDATLHQKALDLARESKIDQAVEALTEFVRLYPRHIDAFSDLGVLNFQQSVALTAIAASHFQEAAKLLPDELAPQKNLACLMMESGQMGKAFDIWRQIADRYPFDGDAQAGIDCVLKISERAKA